MSKRSDPFESAQTFEQIAESFVERIRNGEHPSLEEYQSSFPEYLTEIDELFPTLAELENYDPVPKSNQSPGASPFQAPSRLGNYIIQREIGRGGMGVVYEAKHETMRRRVALKVLPADPKKPDYVKRFLREARAAGQLHHTNIVPVFEVGCCEGVNFYAMQYIHGQNLDVVIEDLKRLQQNGKQASHASIQPNFPGDSTIALTFLDGEVAQSNPPSKEDDGELTVPMRDPNRKRTTAPIKNGDQQQVSTNDHLTKPTTHQIDAIEPDSDTPESSSSSQWSQIGETGDSYYRRVARVGVQIADALEYAHRHGVLHRDIKPSNLILDTDGIVWITDFGLAKDGGDDLTHTGDIVGTLRYMAPERFHGDADVRSEVYSLGLTLYELCTLQHAFENADRAQMVKQITSHSPVSPRKIRPDIPLDLETVIAKAIAREPSHRYSSALQLANDLRRFVSDRPVLARRISVFEKLYRWAKRHPARAALVSCMALICLLITGGSMYLADLQNRHKNELLQENMRVRLERSVADKARENAEQATIQAEIQRKRAERSALGSRAHLYWSEMEKADAIRTSGKQGQNFVSLESIESAAAIVDRLGLKPEKIAARHVALRSVAIAAMTQWDVRPVHDWKTGPEWTTQVAVDFENRRIAQADKAGNIAIRKFGSPDVEFQLPSPGEQAWIPKFSPNGKFFVARHHDPITQRNPITCLWDIDAKKEILRLEQPELGTAHAFSEDSSMLAFCRRGNLIEIYSTATGKIKFRFKSMKLPTFLHFAKHDTQLILAEKDTERIDFWQLTESPKIVTSVDIVPGNANESDDAAKTTVMALDWNDRLEHLVIATGHDILVWPPRGLDQEPIRLTNHDNRVVQLALHPTGKALMSSSWDGTTRLFDLITNKQVIRVEGLRLTHTGFNRQGSHIGYTSKLDEYGIWALPHHRPLKTLISKSYFGAKGPAMFVPGHSEIVAFPTREGLEFWDQLQQTMMSSMSIGDTTHCCFSNSGPYLYTGGKDGIRRWNYSVNLEQDRTGLSVDRTAPQIVYDGAAAYFELHEARQLIAAKTKNHYVTIIDLETQATRDIGPHINVARYKFSPGGRQLITATWQGNGIKIWNTQTGELIKEISPQSSTTSIGVDATNHTLAAVTGSARFVWSMKDWSLISQRPREVRDGWPGNTAYSPDGKLLVTTYSRYLPQLVDSQTGNAIAILDATPELAFENAEWSPDGRFLSMTDKQKIHVWDIARIRTRLRDLSLDWQD